MYNSIRSHAVPTRPSKWGLMGINRSVLGLGCSKMGKSAKTTNLEHLHFFWPAFANLKMAKPPLAGPDVETNLKKSADKTGESGLSVGSQCT